MSNRAKLETADGAAYVNLESVALISQPMQKAGQPEVRRVGLSGGLYVLALNTPENLDTLGLPGEAESLRRALMASQKVKPKRGSARVAPGGDRYFGKAGSCPRKHPEKNMTCGPECAAKGAAK